MDDIVKQAMAKWPNVPNCYGWLALDARGHWRMRDERTQQLNLPGDKLAHVALLAFIDRNYASDERGCWYFQNGPQRVFVNLEATPYIVRSDPEHGWLLHSGVAPARFDAAFLTESGQLIVKSGTVVAQLDDRDFAQVLPLLSMDGQAGPVDDARLLAWLENGVGALSLRDRDHGSCAVQHLPSAQVESYFDFVRLPTLESGQSNGSAG